MVALSSSDPSHPFFDLIVMRVHVPLSLGLFNQQGIIIITIMTSAQRVGFFNIGLGQVLDKIPGSGSGSGQVGASKYTIGYFRVFWGISGYVGYFRE